MQQEIDDLKERVLALEQKLEALVGQVPVQPQVVGPKKRGRPKGIVEKTARKLNPEKQLQKKQKLSDKARAQWAKIKAPPAASLPAASPVAALDTSSSEESTYPSRFSSKEARDRHYRGRMQSLNDIEYGTLRVYEPVNPWWEGLSELRNIRVPSSTDSN